MIVSRVTRVIMNRKYDYNRVCVFFSEGVQCMVFE